MKSKAYPVGKPGQDGYRVVTFSLGQRVKGTQQDTYRGVVDGLGKLYVTVACDDGQSRSFYPHQLET